MESSPADLLIVGASARAAAFSAIRAGFRPICVDLYGDADLTQAAPCHVVSLLSDLPKQLDQLPEDVRQLPWMYTGGLENHPQIVAQISTTRPLLGNSADVLRTVRNPWKVREVLSAARIRCLDLRSTSETPPADGRWLLKPLATAGGRAITVWNATAQTRPLPTEPFLFQEYRAGTSYSAIFVGIDGPADVQFVGLTRQWVGRAECHAPSFAWCGSIGPIELTIPAEILIRRMGNVLMNRCGLKGLFGIDLIVDDEGVPWLTEVNPRYCGSIEVLELACGFSLLTPHTEAWGYGPASTAEFAVPSVQSTGGATVVGKAIIFAPHSFAAPPPPPNATPWRLPPFIADIPQADAPIASQSPWQTVVVSGIDEADCEQKLMTAIAACEIPGRRQW